MLAPARTTQLNDIYEILGQLIRNPKSLGLREHLPPRVLDTLTSTREFLRQEIDGRSPIAAAENDLAAELSQDADTQYGIPEEEQNEMSFHQLLRRRMQQLHLSNYDVAVSLGCTIQHVSDLAKGIGAPTDLDIAELALLLGVTQESLATNRQRKIEGLAAAV
jgi:plasmid maintenance system antidote protein VapI